MLKTKNANMLFNKIIFLINKKLSQKTIYRLKINDRYFCHLQTNLNTQNIYKIR